MRPRWRRGVSTQVRRVAVTRTLLALGAFSLAIASAWPIGKQRGGKFVAPKHQPSEQSQDIDDAQRRRLSAYPEDLLIDTPYGESENRWMIFIHVILIVYMLLGLNVVCEVYFAGSLELMVGTWRVKPDVAGATFMAAGGSAPEFCTSLIGATITEDDVGFGTIVGSAVFNVLFVIGLCGFLSTTPIQLTWWPLFRDCTYYILGLSLLAFCARDSRIEVWEAALLFAGYIAYCSLMYWNTQLEAIVTRLLHGHPSPVRPNQVAPLSECKPSESAACGAGGEPCDGPSSGVPCSGSPCSTRPCSEGPCGKALCGGPCAPTCASDEEPGGPRTCGVGESAPGPPEGSAVSLTLEETVSKAANLDGQLEKKEDAALSELEQKEGDAGAQASGDQNSEEEEEDPVQELMRRPEGTKDQIIWYLSLPILVPIYYLIPKPRERWFLPTFGVSLIWIAALTYFLVWWVEMLGAVLHIHTVIMSFTLLAAGTSIPDAVSSVAVARMGEGDMAISSSIGSNIFDILVGLPIPWMVKILLVERKVDYKIPIRSPYLTFFVLVLLFMVFCVVLSIHLLGWKLNRPLGMCMALLYAIFLGIALSVYITEPSELQF